ncbi:unnamed protein product [Vitrella brassicaformis CCMP3155]|uniref:Uncharacterized protein n=2 Tax=Vitrella brassicaformis TaxID=1169539 RepID=A0A0G4F0V6_VITBC|nr:unnamed protein product [Vitrella brassicaformis CCMP3155]|eukprot:CEM05256.1 unnamed protein product [Vitrella brassicaformis CCMP3155]
MAPKNKGESQGKRSSPLPGHADEAPDEGDAGDDYDNMPVIVKVKPQDQLELTPEELDKEMPPRVLYPQNPRAPQNITQFSFKDRQFKRDDQVDQSVFHFSLEERIFFKDSPEAADQEEMQRIKEEERKKREEAEAVDVEIEQDPDQPLDESQQVLLRNQFNFSDRASQSFNALLRERGVSTEPPPSTDFSGTVTQWLIYDTYMEDIQAQQAREAKEKERGSHKAAEEEPKKKKKESELYSDRMKYFIKITERLVNQNSDNEIYHDFKYYEDRSDEYRDGDGTLLPLWRFASEKSKRKQVTAIKWNPQYKDFFAVGFGSYDFLKQGTGVICCYTLKNTRHPEYSFNTDSGVCCLDWHPQFPSLLAVGLYDGTVLVFDVRGKNRKPLYQSTIRSNKHTDPVWEVRWHDDEASSNLCFYSISSDGRVTSWALMKNKLEPEEVMELKLVGNAGGKGGQEDDTALSGLGGGTCFDFNKFSSHLFLVGTEEGKIHKCSKAYSGQYLETYEGHSMAVYVVKWNTYHQRIFLSASADWTVKLWDHTQKTPIMTFDLAQAVGDAAWAPYASTVFAATTADGVVHVYDLHVNRHDRICDQKVVKRAKLTHLCFNDVHPIVLVGDDRGGINCLKLSPNLRKMPVPSDADKDKSFEELQVDKMNHLLMMVSETVEGRSE